MNNKTLPMMTITSILILSTFSLGNPVSASHEGDKLVVTVKGVAICTILEEGDCGEGKVTGHFTFSDVNEEEGILTGVGKGSLCIFPPEHGTGCAFELESDGPVLFEYDRLGQRTATTTPMESHIGHQVFVYDANGSQTGWEENKGKSELEATLTGVRNGIEIKIEGTEILDLIELPTDKP